MTESTLDGTASTGPDKIPFVLIKAAASFITPTLIRLINATLVTGIFPDELKSAKITPIFKAGDQTLPSNYRPISVLNIMSKPYKKVINTRLVSFFPRNCALYAKQFGFRKNHSPALAITLLTNKLITNFENNLRCIAIFLDFSEAFDTIDFNMLLTKLEHYGIRGSFHSLIQLYLTNRTEYADIDDITPHLYLYVRCSTRLRTRTPIISTLHK